MSTFTLPLKRVIELTGGTTELDAHGVTALIGGDIGLEHFPIFDEAHRPILVGKILDRFWNQEIGVETIDMFRLAMRRKMNEIMPLYNKLYYADSLTFDPLVTTNMATTGTGENVQDSTSTAQSETNSESESENRSVSSETPQTMLAGNADYATAAQDGKGKTVNTGDGTQSSAQKVEDASTTASTVTGYTGVPSHLIDAYRRTLVNVDLAILDDLQELFMIPWNTSDDYTNWSNHNGYYAY